MHKDTRAEAKLHIRSLKMTPLWLVNIKVMPHDCCLLTRSARLGLKAVRPRRPLTVHKQRLKWLQEEVTQSHSWALGTGTHAQDASTNRSVA